MKKIKNKKLVSEVLYVVLVLIAILTAVVFYLKVHPKFDEKLFGKEATVITEVAEIRYDEPFGVRNVGNVTQSQKVKLTGRMEYLLQSDIVMMEICLEDDSFAWISKKDIIISE